MGGWCNGMISPTIHPNPSPPTRKLQWLTITSVLPLCDVEPWCNRRKINQLFCFFPSQTFLCLSVFSLWLLSFIASWHGFKSLFRFLSVSDFVFFDMIPMTRKLKTQLFYTIDQPFLSSYYSTYSTYTCVRWSFSGYYSISVNLCVCVCVCVCVLCCVFVASSHHGGHG